ncbi:hypothetical protein C8Q80DRAFT_260158 [Daedaleopsis nitida]|nr:hypothetical protein C8Q80DRAFT_260158 [Daedaleopsis nitida]
MQQVSLLSDKHTIPELCMCKTTSTDTRRCVLDSSAVYRSPGTSADGSGALLTFCGPTDAERAEFTGGLLLASGRRRGARHGEHETDTAYRRRSGFDAVLGAAGRATWSEEEREDRRPLWMGRGRKKMVGGKASLGGPTWCLFVLIDNPQISTRYETQAQRHPLRPPSLRSLPRAVHSPQCSMSAPRRLGCAAQQYIVCS